MRKERFVFQGHKDKMKQSLTHNTSVAVQKGTKMIEGVAAIFGFKLYCSGVTKAYLQSPEKLMWYSVGC